MKKPKNLLKVINLEELNKMEKEKTNCPQVNPFDNYEEKNMSPEAHGKLNIVKANVGEISKDKERSK